MKNTVKKCINKIDSYTLKEMVREQEDKAKVLVNAILVMPGNKYHKTIRFDIDVYEDIIRLVVGVSDTIKRPIFDIDIALNDNSIEDIEKTFDGIIKLVTDTGAPFRHHVLRVGKLHMSAERFLIMLEESSKEYEQSEDDKILEEAVNEAYDGLEESFKAGLVGTPIDDMASEFGIEVDMASEFGIEVK